MDVQELPVGTALTRNTAPWNALLVGTVKVVRDGGRATAFGRLHRSGKAFDAFATAHGYHPSDANVRYNSFCLPVAANETFEFWYEENSAGCEVKFYLLQTP